MIVTASTENWTDVKERDLIREPCLVNWTDGGNPFSNYTFNCPHYAASTSLIAAKVMDTTLVSSGGVPCTVNFGKLDGCKLWKAGRMPI